MDILTALNRLYCKTTDREIANQKGLTMIFYALSKLFLLFDYTIILYWAMVKIAGGLNLYASAILAGLTGAAWGGHITKIWNKWDEYRDTNDNQWKKKFGNSFYIRSWQLTYFSANLLFLALKTLAGFVVFVILLIFII